MNTVIFACLHNARRSQMAAAFLLLTTELAEGVRRFIESQAWTRAGAGPAEPPSR